MTMGTTIIRQRHLLLGPRFWPIPSGGRSICTSSMRRSRWSSVVSPLRRHPLMGATVLTAAFYACKDTISPSLSTSATQCEAVIHEDVIDRWTEAEEDESSLILRIRLWLQSVLQECFDAVILTLRGTELFITLGPVLVLAPASWILYETAGSHQLADATWTYLIHAVQRLGPCYIKLCQWIATRRDIFPPAVCDRLAVLHDRAYPHPWKHTQQSLREAFGDDYEEKGLHIIPENSIIGCGSAAQVYQGTLQGTPVAVKVLHPRLQALVDRDLWLLGKVSSLLHSLPIERIRLINLPRATAVFADILRRQTDLRVEADNLRKFRDNFYHSDESEEHRSEIIFPRPMDGWSHETVLVEELVHNATPVSHTLQHSGSSSAEDIRRRKQLGSQLFRAFLKMVFLDNFVHCDLHPGNVFVRHLEGDDVLETLTGGKIENKIVFLDAGIAFSLSPNDQRNLRDLFRAVVLNDGKRAGRLMVERAKSERCSQIPHGVEEFSDAMHSLVSEFHSQRGLTFGAVKIGSILNRVLDLCRDYGVEIDPGMSGVVLSCLVLEGLARSLDPSLNLMDAAVPFLVGMGRV